jgi:hypothetical protein
VERGSGTDAWRRTSGTGAKNPAGDRTSPPDEPRPISRAVLARLPVDRVPPQDTGRPRPATSRASPEPRAETRHPRRRVARRRDVQPDTHLLGMDQGKQPIDLERARYRAAPPRLRRARRSGISRSSELRDGMHPAATIVVAKVSAIRRNTDHYRCRPNRCQSPKVLIAQAGRRRRT